MDLNLISALVKSSNDKYINECLHLGWEVVAIENLYDPSDGSKSIIYHLAWNKSNGEPKKTAMETALERFNR